MCILLGILEIARKQYFYLVEREDEKKQQSKPFGKTTKLLNIFPQKEENFKVK